MPLPFAGPVTFRYIAPQATLADAEAWCEANGLAPCRLELGPDGLIRGTCVVEAPEKVGPPGPCDPRGPGIEPAVGRPSAFADVLRARQEYHEAPEVVHDGAEPPPP